MCRGLLAKESEICGLLVEKELDIFFLQETDIMRWSSALFNIPGYISLTHNGEKKRTITLIKKELANQVEQRQDIAGERPEVWFDIEDNNGKKITIGNIYREHGRSEKDTTDAGIVTTVADTLCGLIDQGHRVLIAGDFNMDLYEGEAAHTRMFRERITEAGFDVHGFGDTFYRLVKGREWASKLDWILTYEVAINKTWKEENAASDHHVIGWNIEGKDHSSTHCTKSRSMKSLVKNKERFLLSLLNHPWEDLPSYSLEHQATLLCQRIVRSLDEVAPVKHTRQRKHCCPLYQHWR